MKAVLHPVNQPLTPGLDAASDLLKKYEASCKLRINVLGALHYGAISSRLIWESRTSNWDSLSFLKFIWHRVAGLDTALGEVPVDWKVKSRRVVVLDNYRVDQSRLVKSYLAVLKKVGVVFFYLPPYSPELNLIEAEWRQIKYQGLPCHSFVQLYQLLEAVNAAMTLCAA